TPPTSCARSTRGRPRCKARSPGSSTSRASASTRGQPRAPRSSDCSEASRRRSRVRGHVSAPKSRTSRTKPSRPPPPRPIAAPRGRNVSSDFNEEEQALLRRFFRAEAEEHLDGAQRAVRRLGTDASDRELLAEIFRFLHTLKGAAGTVGLSEVT